MSDGTSIHVSLIIERRVSDHPWLDHEWRVAGMLPVPDHDIHRAPMVLERNDSVCRWLCEPVLLELHRTDADAYVYNLTSPSPSVFAVAQEYETPVADGLAWRTHLVTLSSYEAEEYMTGEDALIGKLPLPDDIREWLEAFVALHYTNTPFKKRRRDRLNTQEHKFGQETLMELRRRMAASGKGNGEVH